jgi:hypothetical protein
MHASAALTSIGLAAALGASPPTVRAADAPDPAPVSRDAKTPAQSATQPNVIKRGKRVYYTIPARKRTESR